MFFICLSQNFLYAMFRLMNRPYTTFQIAYFHPISYSQYKYSFESKPSFSLFMSYLRSNLRLNNFLLLGLFSTKPTSSLGYGPFLFFHTFSVHMPVAYQELMMVLKNPFLGITSFYYIHLFNMNGNTVDSKAPINSMNLANVELWIHTHLDSCWFYPQMVINRERAEHTVFISRITAIVF